MLRKVRCTAAPWMVRVPPAASVARRAMSRPRPVEPRSLRPRVPAPRGMPGPWRRPRMPEAEIRFAGKGDSGGGAVGGVGYDVFDEGV